MNINNFSHSSGSSKHQGNNKYFSKGVVLDESLTEFQEKKEIIGPKKPLKSAPKRKPQKHIKGQRDIRSLVKKKNDLVQYSKDFDKICKESGIDIDSEQLQLAITLSKSLHYSKQRTDDNATDVTKPLTSLEKTNKIRTTLQEYGFKVREVKDRNVRKKIINSKICKLFSTTNEEKKQIISEKYSQILSLSINNVGFESDIPKEFIFHKATNMFYDNMKNDDVFYVSGLFEKALDSINLLKEWSNIPGRCHSPVFEGPCIGFNDIKCSQDELDILLSGCLEYTQNLYHEKLRDNTVIKEHSDTSHSSIEQSRNLLSDKTISEPLSKVVANLESETDFHNLETPTSIISKSKNETLTGSKQRSLSPDMFDDEVSSIMDRCTELSTPRVEYETIDLTQCVSTNVQPKVSNVTKRLSNDAMELTGCIVKSYNYDRMYLSQHINDDDNTIIYVDEDTSCRKGMSQNFTSDINSKNSPRIDNEPYIILDEINKDSQNYKENIQITDTVNLTLSSDTCDSMPNEITKNCKLGNINEKYVTDFACEIFDDNISTTVLNSSKIMNPSTKDKGSNNCIDLTQPENSHCILNSISNLSQNDSLGKIDNASVDYDDMFDEIIEKCSNISKLDTQHKNSSFSKNEESTSSSDHFRISNQEQNYPVINYNDTRNNNSEVFQDSELPSIYMNSPKNIDCKTVTPVKEKYIEFIKTPNNCDYTIKTVEVTPMQNFEEMTSPERNTELEKYGLKPFKRKRAIQLLTYIYNQTHPVVESCEDGSPSKKTKLNSPKKINSPRNLNPSPNKSPRKLHYSLKKIQKSPAKSHDANDKENIYVQTNDAPVVKDIVCEPEDWVFQKREKAKVHSCRVPLHIAFHNYLSCRRLLKEAILCYEPINIDIVHKGLLASGYRYNPKDLLKFLDKKCITVKTVDKR